MLPPPSGAGHFADWPTVAPHAASYLPAAFGEHVHAQLQRDELVQAVLLS